MARRRGGSRAHMAYMRSLQKNRRRHRRRYRRNPFPVGGLVVNPRRRRYRRNPVLAGVQIPSLQPVLYAGAGFAGTVALENVLTAGDTPLIPTTITGTSLGKYAVRIGCAIATSFLAKMALGSEKAKMVGLGGGVYVLTSAVREFMPGTIPGMSGYTGLAGMRAYRQMGDGARVVAIGSRPAALAAYSGDQERFSRF